MDALVQSLNCTLLELPDDGCRYPTTEEGPFLFCGLPQVAGKSYCPRCCAVVFKLQDGRGNPGEKPNYSASIRKNSVPQIVILQPEYFGSDAA